ncbi:hypothetical protein CsatB_015770 [Cannabis sativa]
MVLVAILFLVATTTSTSDHGVFSCIESERQALLTFKQGLDVHDNVLSSWNNNNKDCCSWRGIRCHNLTNHIIKLHLRPNITYDHGMPTLYPILGQITSSLLKLKYLEYLDLSNNDFYEIPKFIGGFTNLKYLNLSNNQLIGNIPSQLGNLTKLRVLDLGDDYGFGTNLTIKSFNWISHLTNLRILKLGGTNLTEAKDWFSSFKTAHSLSILHLNYCQFPELDHTTTNSSTNSITTLHVSDSIFGSTTFSHLLNLSNNLIDLSLNYNNKASPVFTIPDSFENLKSLRRFNFQWNQFRGEIPKSIGSLCKLQELVLYGNEFNSTIIDILKNLIDCNNKSLEILDLSYNNLSGPLLPKDYFSKIPHLRKLDVSHNKFNVKWAESIISNLSSLELLDISVNVFTGIVIETHLEKLSKLEHLDLSSNFLTLKIETNWVPPFQLQHLGLRSCMIGPQFPSWLQTQTNISLLDLSDSRIFDIIPIWFFNQTYSKLSYLDLSFNTINDTLPDIKLKSNNFAFVDLRANKFHGSVSPNSLFKANALYLSNNTLTTFHPLFCSILLPSHHNLQILDLSNNQLFGNIPHCLFHLQNLKFLNLFNNRLFGLIPSSIASLYQIQMLDLSQNNLSGILPSSMKNCTQLLFLDIGENNMRGNIPMWIGEMLKQLVFLRLNSNHFYGTIPTSLCHLNGIRILDISHNNISGLIPSCINNFTYESTSSLTVVYASGHFSATGFDIKTKVTWKGKEYEYQEILGLLRIIDFSSNKLIGEIPMELTNLVELLQLNLSRNNLSGVIPWNIGNLSKLEALDLSHNNFSGEIPIGLGELSFLQYLDLSYNHFSGKIPISTQLQSFNASSYVGNGELCGLPLSIECSSGNHATFNPHSNSDDDDQEWFDMSWFYIGLEVGIALGFIGVCGALYRNSYLLESCLFLGCLNKFGDWLSVH